MDAPAMASWYASWTGEPALTTPISEILSRAMATGPTSEYGPPVSGCTR